MLRSKTHRCGLTLLELLVAVSIIGMLMSLLLPAVQQSRENGRRVTCANHLKQVGLAMANLENAHTVLPSNGGWDGKQRIKDIQGNLIEVSTQSFITGKTYVWGVGDPQLGPRTQTGSWAYAILPYLERNDIFNSRAWTTSVSLYGCPSRRPAVCEAVAAQDAYGKYQGGGWSWCKIDYAANGLVVENRPHCFPMAAFFDGTSHTVLIAEKAFDPTVQTDMTWCWDEPFFLGGSGGTMRNGYRLWPDGRGISFKGNWGAAHPSGAQAAFADGSVRLLPFRLDWTQVRALLTPKGEEIPWQDLSP